MSWNAYIDNLMQSANVIVKAAIIGKDDGSMWAKSEGGDKAFTASAEETKNLADLFKTPGDALAKGVRLENEKFVVPQADESVIMGMQTGGSQRGFIACKTNMSIVIALFTGDRSASVPCRTAVEKMAEYLKSSGY